ncbi:GLPGLI family protein [Chryseobacterium sp.]|uniref:GLPGLI family protein n=1 Tax=Chryseobacterium sp. TaxID=1871047 RepID=UPI001B1F5715|nr:GLPGLI family protein [Chryseobacterium sp.]MBO9693658.1 GLPGLI family protein [Chryseobacterium sp.]
MKILSIIFILTAILTNSQTHRYIYELKYKPEAGAANYKKQLMVLDVNPDDIKYYDYKFLEKDSLNQLHKSQDRTWTSQIPVSRKKDSDKNINYVLIGDNIYSYPTEDKMQWSLEKETKQQDGLSLQKAVTKYGGRHWVAWFTKDIPFNQGPYKFQGLPGLIMEINDTEDNFIFKLVKSTNLPATYDTSNILEVRYGDKPIPTNEKTVIKKAIEYFNNPLNDIRQEFINNKISSFEYNGVKYKPEELSGLIKEEQEYILKNYNPIELDKSFPYKQP